MLGMFPEMEIERGKQIVVFNAFQMKIQNN